MTQNERILKYLDDFGSITPAQAMVDLGVFRLSARILELKRRGAVIETVMVPYWNRYGEKGHYAMYKRVE